MGGSEIEGGICIVRKDVCSNVRVDLGGLPDMAHGVVREAPILREVSPPPYSTLSFSPSRASTCSLITAAVLLVVFNLRDTKCILNELSATGFLHVRRLCTYWPLRRCTDCPSALNTRFKSNLNRSGNLGASFFASWGALLPHTLRRPPVLPKLQARSFTHGCGVRTITPPRWRIRNLQTRTRSKCPSCRVVRGRSLLTLQIAWHRDPQQVAGLRGLVQEQ